MILFFCGFAILASALGQGCEQGWTEFQGSGKCYKAVNVFMTWEKANYTCVAKYDAELVSIHSMEENNFISDLIKLDDIFAAWIGAIDIGKSQQVYVWSDGSEFNFSNWYIEKREPRYPCAGIGGDLVNKKWGTEDCNKPEAPFVCQRESICNEGWSKDPATGSCFQILSDELSWEEARDQCMSLDKGSDLASIRTDQENEFVKSLLRENDSKPGVQGFWIGGNDINDEGSWVWTDESLAEFTDWHNGQGTSTKHKDCNAMWKSFDYEWKDWQCKMTLPSVCKIENKK